jgi:glycine cleavage system aminomethyltransferase T
VTSEDEPNPLALHAWHANAGASFAAIDGWEVPADYGDPAAELAALRGGAAIVDRSNAGRLLVHGTDAGASLAAVLGPGAAELEEGRSRMFALESGPAEVVRTGAITYMVMVEPDRAGEACTLLAAAIPGGFDAAVEDRTAATCLVSVIGPGAADAVERQVQAGLTSRLPRGHALAFELQGFRALASHSAAQEGDCFDFVLAPAVAAALLEALRSAGVTIAGQTAWRALARETRGTRRLDA